MPKIQEFQLTSALVTHINREVCKIYAHKANIRSLTLNIGYGRFGSGLSAIVLVFPDSSKCPIRF